MLLNGQAATEVLGNGGGPYLFSFPETGDGSVRAEWAGNTDIHDPNNPALKFVPGPSWNYNVDSALPLPKVRINEILASNVKGLLDEAGGAEDWIEIYNADSNALNLDGWSLTDDPTQPNMWTFPAVLVPPGGYLVVFASGKDIRAPLTGRHFHTNFKLGDRGEYLGLYSSRFASPARERIRAGVSRSTQ